MLKVNDDTNYNSQWEMESHEIQSGIQSLESYDDVPEEDMTVSG